MVNNYLTRPRGPLQVKECKIILEQSLLTGWLTGWLASGMNCQPRFQFYQSRLSRTLERGCDFRSGQMRTKQEPCLCRIDEYVSEGPQTFRARELTY